MGAPAGIPLDEVFHYGVDLFNARFYWEAHEAWERVWRMAPDQPEYWATKGLIQVTASLLTLYMVRTDAARTLAERGASLLERAACRRPRIRGVELESVADEARQRVARPRVLPTLEQAAFRIELVAAPE